MVFQGNSCFAHAKETGHPAVQGKGSPVERAASLASPHKAEVEEVFL